jgi:hypothetical protein
MKPIHLAGLVLLVAASSCSDATSPQNQRIDLEMAQQRWHAQNLHTYAFTLQRICECLPTSPLYVAVVNDAVVEVLNLQTGEAVDLRLGQSIDGLFTFIQNAIDRHAARIQAEYDDAKGFPSSIDYDGATQIADDEISYRVTDVHPITPQS